MAAIAWKDQTTIDAEAAAAEAERQAAEMAEGELDQAIAEATTLNELKDALRGMTRPGRVRARPT